MGGSKVEESVRVVAVNVREGLGFTGAGCDAVGGDDKEEQECRERGIEGIPGGLVIDGGAFAGDTDDRGSNTEDGTTDADGIYLVTLRKDHGGSETLLVEPISDALVSLKDKSFYLGHPWVQGHLYYGLTTMLIRIEKPGTQTYQIDYYFKIFPLNAQNMEAT
ncbi:hypothetical protein DKX38_015478 [Salix brachista]|uniref:Uncharacterized protein n=1 Tax=Salix brachista TaxID=2182728 RepID=A0A5N5L5A6_9ROSI|nr:hypothetical protein DKX38_015478 [Salix brachista]